ncbi:probable E3 SUMO-protein ligase RNF212 isoform X1 [Ovis aries]|uniref:probable E3 SUMO-protein ligase RNF212 isoform X1 n=1 Tax=Ovis aries TaxID=9940 RepID=UPI001C2E905E|nr:probable E3 SUMO-protein ligase RNF212 isoform X1 [Ovis aries]
MEKRFLSWRSPSGSRHCGWSSCRGGTCAPSPHSWHPHPRPHAPGSSHLPRWCLCFWLCLGDRGRLSTPHTSTQLVSRGHLEAGTNVLWELGPAAGPAQQASRERPLCSQRCLLCVLGTREPLWGGPGPCRFPRVRSSQQTAFSTVKTAASTPSAKPSGPLLFQPRGSSASERAESMEVDFTPSPRRKQTGTVSAPEPVWSVSGHFLFMRQPEVATGPPRISLLSPPRDGRMGSIAHRPQHLGLTPRCSSEPQAPRIPALQMPREWPRQSPAPAAGRGAAPRQPISVSGLMQRQRPGPAGLGGLARE